MLRLEEQITERGFAFVPAADMRALLQQHGNLSDWDAFIASWDDLHADTFMADAGRYRKRRYAVYSASPAGITREKHQPHYQDRDYNALNGGIERWFEPVTAELDQTHSLQTLLKFCQTLFSALGSTQSWHIETHQFRIEARADEQGQPTPEGMHRDGVDYVLVLLIRRENIQSGTTTITDPQHQHLDSFTLTQPFDAALIDDHRALHGVTAVMPVDPTRPAYRDVLVITFTRQ